MDDPTEYFPTNDLITVSCSHYDGLLHDRVTLWSKVESQAEEITRLRADKEPFTAPWDGSIYYGLNPKAHAILSRQKELAEARAEAAEAECQGLRERLRERSTTP